MKSGPHLYAFRGSDRTTLYCTACGDRHWIILADPTIREMTIRRLRERGEIGEGVR